MKNINSINTNICRAELTKYEELIPSDDISPSIKKISFDPQKTYKFVLYDIETASAARNTELLQLSPLTDDYERSYFNYILPNNNISSTATSIHKIAVGYSGGQRILYKDGKELSTISLPTYLSMFTLFDIPRLLLNGGVDFVNRLAEDMKFLRSPKLITCSTNKLGAIYEDLFHTNFEAHDALEDVKALRRILFTSPLQVSTEIMITHGNTTSPKEALGLAMFCDRRQEVVQSYAGKLYFTDKTSVPASLSFSMIQKLADARLALNTLYEKFGLNGLYGVLPSPPSVSQKSPRVASNKRILSIVLTYFSRSH